MENMLKGHFVWLFGAIFAAVILMFITRNAPSALNAGWFIGVFGSICAFVLQAWHHNKYKTTYFDLLNVGIAVFVFVVAGVIRAFVE